MRKYTVLLVALCLAPAALSENFNYPPTRTDSTVDTLHGVQVPDPYRWLESVDEPEVQHWTELQNALTRSALDRFPKERAKLKSELETLYAAASMSSPRVYGTRYFYTRRSGSQNHAQIWMQTGNLESEARLVLDPNTFSDDGTVALDWWFPSPDGSVIAYGKSAGGSEKSVLHLRDVKGGFDGALQIPHTRANTVAWDADGQGFLYIRYPEPGTVPANEENYHRHVFHHRFGTDWTKDPKVFGDSQPKEQWHTVYASSDWRYRFLSASMDWARNDLFFCPSGSTEFKPLAVGHNARFSADVLGDSVILLTDLDAPRFRVLRAPLENPDAANWKEIVPQQTGVIQGVTIANGRLVLNILENAYSKLAIYSPDGKLEREVPLPTLGTVGGVSGQPDKPELFFSFESFAFPPTVYRMNLDAVGGAPEIVEQMKLENVNLQDYVTEQVWFQSADGVRVPMFVIRKQNVKLDGNNPTVLYGYGGFNISQTPSFVRGLIPWLDRGGVYAIANLRGGGEFGKDWHLAGRLERKQNVFNDMIAAAEKLIADKYTKPEKLGIRGGSNGGLLVGAMIVQRPDLFRAVHCAVPLLDMIRYHRLSIARLWIPEYGSAEDSQQFKTLLSYSPYHHVKPGTKYPATLLTTGESDSRVDPMHARKMAAALQAATASDLPVLLWVETKAGHGAGKPLSKVIESSVDYWIFFMWQLGMLDGESAGS